MYNQLNPVGETAMKASVAALLRTSVTEVTRRMPRVLMTAAIIALSAAGVVEAQAANYYVALSGSDGNPGTQAAPFRTINHLRV